MLNTNGNRREWCLFPVLARMELDTKERYKFFCCSAQHACAIGSGPRKGHSNFRRCTPHSSRTDLYRKRQIISGETEPDDGESVHEAEASLKRRGLHPHRVCTAINNCQHVIMRWPGRIYHGLFAFDVMHVLYINCIGYLQDALLSLLTPAQKKRLDRRVRSFTAFRNPVDGVTTRKVTSLTSIGYMTAELRVIHLFIWSHAIGSKAEIFNEGLRDDVLAAICSLQVICFSVRSKRPYTETEHKFIFGHHGKRFFRCMEKLCAWKKRQQIREAERYNVDRSPAKRRRVPYWKNPTKCDDESSDTASSSEADDTSPLNIFERSDKIIPHSIVHFPDQVIMGGTHNFHDTSGPEACHKRCIQLAGQRARIYSDVNCSTQSMLAYMMQLRLLRKIFDVTIPPNEEDRNIANDHDPDVHELKTVRLTSPIDTRDNGLTVLYRGRRGMGEADRELHRDTWDTILCEGVPISLRELVLLAADRLNIGVNMPNAHKLLRCSWSLGWHVSTVSVRGTTRHYWGGGVTPATSSNYLRGDWVETNITDESNGIRTSRLARVICGVQIQGVRQAFAGFAVPPHMWETDHNRENDTVFFLLVRYAAPHPSTGRGRGPCHRPLCPGVLKDTHCLWSWAQRRANFQRGCLRGRSWDRNKRFFGNNARDQDLRKDREGRAWYDLIQSFEIVAHSNVQLDPDRNQSFLQSVMWC